jgi:hypothetical protein
MLWRVVVLACLAYFVHSATTVTQLGFNDTWTAEGSPYLVQNTLTVPENGTLTILAGVTAEIACTAIIFANNANIVALGNSTHPIILTAARIPITCRWGGLEMRGLSQDKNTGQIVFSSVIIANAATAPGITTSLLMFHQYDSYSNVTVTLNDIRIEQNIGGSQNLILANIHTIAVTNSTFAPGTNLFFSITIVDLPGRMLIAGVNNKAIYLDGNTFKNSLYASC